MSKSVLVLILCTLAAGSVHAADSPSLFSPAVDGHNYIPGGRDICWSEPVDLNDYKITSEIIGAFGLESEMANDFILATPDDISVAIGYGGYYNWVQGDPPVTSFNWKFYQDGGCYPTDLFDTYAAPGTTTFIGYDGFGYPTYRIELDVYVQVLSNNIYWFGFQAADHPFPPQWGRQGTGGIVTNCETVFKSEYFGYPDWTPAGDLVGAPFDAAQEFDCGWTIPPIATQQTSWGAVKGLFR